MPSGYAAQLALYRGLLQQIYPEREVRAFLVWTAGPVIREPSAAELEAVLRALPTHTRIAALP
jgi:ATP-dependent helicase/nuclease subunit A